MRYSASIMMSRIALTLWVGGLWTVGYVAAPMLFSVLEQPALAGRLAGELFTAMAYIGLACGAMLMVGQLLRRPHWRNWRLGVVLLMLVLTLIGEFVLRPLMLAETGAAFARLHGASQLLFLLVSVLGLALVLFGIEPDEDAQSSSSGA